MRKTLLGSLTSLLIPFASYGANISYGAYQRRQSTYIGAHQPLPLTDSQHHSFAERTFDPNTAELDISVGAAATELVIIDAAVPDKHILYRAAKPGVDIVEITSSEPGLAQLTGVLSRYKNLSALHIVSHALHGELLLGNSRISAENIKQEIEAFAALNGALRDGGDLLLYGCDLAAGDAGTELLEIIRGNTHLDVAASSDKTGARDLTGDWELEISTGNIETELPFSDKALKDFSAILAAANGTYDFSGFTDAGATLTSTDFIVSAKDSSGAPSVAVSIYGSAAFLDSGMVSVSNYFYVTADGVNTGSFELTGLAAAEYYTGEINLTNVRIVGILRDNSQITSTELDGSLATGDEDFIFGAGQLSNFAGVQLKAFKLYFDVTTRTPAGGGGGPFVGDAALFDFNSFTIANAQNPAASDGNLTGSVTEPVGLDTTVDTVGEAVDVFDFNIADGGAGDTYNLTVSELFINVSGTSTDDERSQVTWRLHGPDHPTPVEGTYNAGTDTITFPGLSIDVANGGNETYFVDAYYNDTLGLTEDHTFILSVDGDSNLTVGALGTQMGSTTAVTNGTGSTIDVVATQLAFTTEPAGSVSGAALTTQPVMTAQDEAFNTDVDFTETITLTEASAGTLTNNTQAATAGVATFTNLTYTAMVDGESFTLTANDQDGVGTDLPTENADPVTSDVVATKLVFTTQPAPTSVNSGDATSFTTVPVISATDANDTVDTGYATDITLAEVNGAGSATMSATGDTDGNGSTVSITPSSGVSTFTGMQITYTASGGSSETFNLRASSGGLTTADSNQLTGVVNAPPAIANLNGDSVAWAGIGSTVALDSSGNATASDAELDALNGANGNYSGGSLTVQRNGGAVASDTLGFDTSGALFTVSGGNLQSGGQTFATFTNTNGVLTISFTSSNTTATTALVSNVLQRVTYRNDTPAGDATVRFTLSDGTATTTADVTVTTDNIYITNTSDTAAIDPTDGTSFSEAIAIAAADVTGTQTLILDSSLAAQTISTTSATSLTESLTLNMDSASGATLSGGTLTLGGGITLTMNNGTSDTASIGTAFGGTGALAKTGDGAVTLTGSQSYSGITTITGGTVSVASDSNLGSDQLVLNGGTLSTTSNTTIDNPINIATDSTFNHSTDASLSGLFSGNANLSLTGSGELQITNTGNEASSSATLTLVSGSVWLNNDDVLPSGAITLNGGTLSTNGLSGTSRTIDNNVVLGASGGTLDIFGGGGNFTLELSGVVSGTGDLLKTSAAMVSLTGTNTYTGTTTIQNGQVVVAGDSNLGSGSVVFNGGTLTVTGSGITIDNSVTMTGSGTLSNANDITLSGVISSTGTLTKTGAGTLTLSGTQTQTGGLVVTGGAVSVAVDSNLGSGTITLHGGGLTVTGTGTIDNAFNMGSNDGTLSNANAVTLSGIISNSGDLSKTGAGILTLSATNTFTGATTISTGTLIVSGSLAGAVTVENGALLQVDNSIGGLVTVNSGGFMATNSSPTAVTLGNGLTVNAGGTINARITGNTAGTGYDQYNVTGAVTLGGSLNLTGTYTPVGGDTFVVINNDAADAVTGTFNGLAEGNAISFSGEQLAVSYLASTGNDVTLSMVAPAVNSVSVPSNGTYITGQNLDFTVNTDENITVNTTGGTPQIALTVGATTRQASYLSGSGTSAIVFRYTVQAGDSDTDGIAVAGTIDANGGTLQDGSGNNLNTVLNSVGATTSVLVDAVAPTVSSVSVPANATYVTGQNLDFTVNTDENVTVNTGGGSPRVALTIGATTRYASYLSGSGTSAMVFRYTVQAGDNDTDGIAVAAAIDSNSGTLRDTAGNDLNTTLNSVGSTVSVLVDAVDPTVNSVSVPANATYVTGQNLDFTVNANENITVNTGGGTPRIALTIGATTRYASYLNGSGTSAIVFRYTVQAGDSDTDGIAVAASIEANGGTLRDGVGNDLDTTLNSVGSTVSVLVDTIAPTVSSVNVPANSTYTTGQNLDFTVNADENITVNTGGGTPRIALTIGATTRYANYLSGSGTSAVVFRYTVQAGDNDTDGIAVAASLEANSGTLQDGAGNNLNTTLNSVGSTVSVLVDGVAPTVSSVSVPANGTYTAGQNLDFTVNTDENVTVNTTGGTPQLALTIGATTRNATYLSGSGTSAIVFRYTVQAGDTDTNGIAVAASIDVNGGTLRDGAGNNLNTTLNSVGATTSVLVDAQAPTLNSSSPADNAGGVAFDANIVLNFSENISAGAGSVSIYDAADDSLVESLAANTLGIVADVVTIDLSSNLTPTHNYYVQISNNAFSDAAGNLYAGIADETTLNFTVGNNAPVANDDSDTTDEDTAVAIDVLANDTDSDSSLNAASTAIGTAPANGSTSINTANGVITYTPAADFNGSDSFTYTVEDVYGTLSNTATVSITINAVNDAPVAVADMATTTEEVLVSIDVAANDTDVDTGDSVDPATIVIASAASNGSAVVNAGLVDYTPDTDFSGTDSFSYSIEDQNGAVSNTVMVTINVTGVNDLPTAANDSATTNEDEDVDIDVLVNDSDLDGSIDGTTVQVMSAPANGSTFVDALTGVITYTPDANYFGSDSFTYVVQDDAGGTSNAATVTLTIISVNDTPVAANDTAMVQEDASIEVNVLGNDSDVDGTLVPASVAVLTPPAEGATSINATTGAITYTPNANFSGSDTFTYRVQDNEGLWSAPATVTMTINNVNDTPTANDDNTTTVEDTAVIINLVANDTDIDDGLNNASVVIVSTTTNGGLVNNNNGTVTYTPDLAYVGGDSFSYTVADNSAAVSNVATVSITVTPGNEAPVISGSPATSGMVGEAYSFTPSASDPDTEDTLTFSVSGQPAWLSINTATGVLSGTPADAHTGTTGSIIISVSDGEETVSLAAFTITVAEGTDTDSDTISDYQEGLDMTDPLDPMSYLDLMPPDLLAPADVTLDAFALYTPVHIKQLLGLELSASDNELQTALDALASDNVDGDGCCNPDVENLLLGSILLLPPGRNEVTWMAEDFMGNTSEVTQIVNVRPLVSLSKDQTTVEGASATLSIILNGESPFYPFTVPFVIDDSSTADGNDHNLVAGTVTFTESNGVGQTRATISVDILTDAMSEGEETLVVNLDDRTSHAEDLANGYDPDNPDIYDINSGARTRHTIRIVEGNLAPDVSLQLQQNGVSTVLVAANGGPITATAQVLDPNPGDTQSYDWSRTDNSLVDTDGNAQNAAFVFDPSGLSPGRYAVRLDVTDSQGAVGRARLFFRVLTNLPTLSAETDSDGDGIDDLSESTSDTDDDGIPDYLDNISASNVIPEEANQTRSFLMECDPGVLCRLGRFALLGATGGTRLEINELNEQDDLAPDADFDPIGGIFDFEIRDLPEAGQSVRIAIPLREAIPQNAVYRKFRDGAWHNFVDDANNALHSTAGNEGYCPPPGDEAWEPGLVTGHLCVQLTIEDGGPNDADGEVNAAIEDPGAVSVASNVSHNVRSSGGGGSVGFGLLFTLALLLLAKFPRKNPKMLTAFAPLLLAGTLLTQTEYTQAQEWQQNVLERSSIKLAVYQTESSQSGSEFVNAMAADGVTVDLQRYDTSRTAWQLTYGYRVHERITLQVGYLDLGEVDIDFAAVGPDNATLETALEQHYPAHADGWTVGYRFTQDLANNFFVSLDAGLYLWRGEIDVSGAPINPDNDGGLDPLLGVGLNYRLFEHVKLGVALQRVFLKREDVDLLGAQIGWYF